MNRWPFSLKRWHWQGFTTGILLFATTAIGAGIRLRHLADECPWYDEIITFAYLSADSLSEFLAQTSHQSPLVPPVYLTLEYFWAQWVGSSVFCVRLLSVILGTACIPLVFLVARSVYGRSAGLLAACLLMLNTQHLYYSQEIRMYALLAMLGLLSGLAFLKLMQTWRLTTLLAGFVANALLVFTHPFGLMLPVAEGLTLLFFRGSKRHSVLTWVGLHCAVLTALVLWLATRNLASGTEDVGWLSPPTLLTREQGPTGSNWPSSVEGVLLVSMGMNYRRESEPNMPPLSRTRQVWADAVVRVSLLFVLLRVVTDVFGACCSRRHTERQQDSVLRIRAVFLSLWVAVPIAALLLGSTLWQPMFFARYLLFATVVVPVLATGALRQVSQAATRRFLGAVLVLAALGQLLALPAGPLRRDWAAIACAASSAIKPTDTVVYHGKTAEAATLAHFLHCAQCTSETSAWLAAIKAMRAVEQGKTVWILTVEERAARIIGEEIERRGGHFAVVRLDSGESAYAGLVSRPSQL